MTQLLRRNTLINNWDATAAPAYSNQGTLFLSPPPGKQRWTIKNFSIQFEPSAFGVAPDTVEFMGLGWGFYLQGATVPIASDVVYGATPPVYNSLVTELHNGYSRSVVVNDIEIDSGNQIRFQWSIAVSNAPNPLTKALTIHVAQLGTIAVPRPNPHRVIF